MKLWILRPAEGLPKNDNPWNPWYDKCFGFIIAASSEDIAREIAQKNAGDEGGDGLVKWETPWLNPNYSTCKQLRAEDFKEGVVMKDFASA